MHVPFLMGEGSHLDHDGNLICSTYVDFRPPSERRPIERLVKGSRREHAIELSRTIQIAKPEYFRHFGENLIRDLNEAYATQVQVTREVIDDPNDLAVAKRRDEAKNRAAELVGSSLTTHTKSIRRTESNATSYTFGKNGWIFCTSLEPTTSREWERWQSTLDAEYDHVTLISRPRELARALAVMVAEQLGPQGEPSSVTHSITGLPTLSTSHGLQMIYHGPVIYVDDVYSLLNAATTETELMLLPLFAKEKKYEPQREYRFAIWAGEEPVELTQILDASQALTGCISEGKRGETPQFMPSMELLAEEAEDFDSQEISGGGSVVQGKDKSGKPKASLIDGLSLEGELFRSFAGQGPKPSTVVRSRKIEPNELPDDFSAATATYPAVLALQQKVGDAHESNELTSEQLVRVAAAAWYAEQDVRALCQTIHDPECGVSISEDEFIVIRVTLSDWPDVKFYLAVGPTGESALNLIAPRRRYERTWEHQYPRNDMGRSIMRFMAALTADSSP